MKYPLFLKKIIHNSKYKIQKIIHPNYIQLDWVKSLNNFGDILNPILIQNLTSKHIININATYCKSTHLLAIGSILQRANSKSIIWGSGFISEDSMFESEPKMICAVRGPLTRSKLIEKNIDCPKVYGDPALLFPKYYQPKTKKEFKLGVLAHYVDKNNRWLLEAAEQGAHIIDVQNTNPLKVVDEIYKCENIASSSLHGLIIADAYKIPSLWIKISNKITGGSFKFHDYYASINLSVKNPIIINTKTSVSEIINACTLKEVQLDLQKLLNAFPKI